jgi:hypothetical protein
VRLWPGWQLDDRFTKSCLETLGRGTRRVFAGGPLGGSAAIPDEPDVLDGGDGVEGVGTGGWRRVRPASPNPQVALIEFISSV